MHSAQPSSLARRHCPELIIIAPDMAKYRQASQAVLAILRDYSELIEPLSLDEAFLDVTGSTVCRGSASLMAREIRERVKRELGISLSAGIAPNKFLAKIASDWNKPDGQFVITPAEVAGFVARLPVGKLPGVGKITARKMQRLGINTCHDLQAFTLPQLLEQFGSFGERLYSLCRGEDKREVKSSRERKSISVEHTFERDLPDLVECLAALPELLQQLEQRVRRSNKDSAIAKQFVKLRFNDFISTTVEQNSRELNMETFRQLCSHGFQRRQRPVRLLGLGIRLRQQAELQQLPLPFPS